MGMRNDGKYSLTAAGIRSIIDEQVGLPGLKGGSQRHAMSQVLALMWITGAALVLVVHLAPLTTHSHDSTALWLALSAAPGATALLAMSRLYGEKLPEWVLHVALVASTVVMSISVFIGRGSPAAIASSIDYVWVVLYAFYFFNWSSAVLQLVVVYICFSLALWNLPFTVAFSVGLLVLGGVTIAGMIVGYLTKELRRQAFSDPLTGLPNRKALVDMLGRELARAARAGESLVVAIIDLDWFKEVNDSDGHSAGDRLLVEVSRCWQGVLRNTDLLARFGGDEFVVVLPGCDLDRAAIVFQRLRGSVGSPFSVGATCYVSGDSLETMLIRADKALYQAKDAGRDRVVVMSVA